MKRYITTPIYYVNDVPHLGHAYTTVAADVLARYYRLKGDEVKFLTGTDEHGQKVADSASKADMTPEEFADKNSAEFQRSFEELGIEFGAENIFMRTTKPEHAAAVNVFMKKLDDAGALEEGEYEGLYCKGCEDFKTEKELVDGLCSIHKTKPELLKEKNWFFKLRDYKKKVRKLIESGELVVEPEASRHEVLNMLDDLPDFSVTRQRVKWGVPFYSDPSQIVYVWVEALQNYISALGYPDGEDFMNFWPADLHLMAKDIVKFHAVYWPAMLLAAGEKLPKKIFAHGFFTLNGMKMSKSLGNVVHPHELVEKYGVDATRYLLLSQFPFGHDGDFSLEHVGQKYEADLVSGLGNLVSRVTTLVETRLGGNVTFGTSLIDSRAEFDQAMERLAFTEALEHCWAAIQAADHFLDQEKPWKQTDYPILASVLGSLMTSLDDICDLLAPFLPQTTEKIRTAINANPVMKIQPLFPRL
jgi:methionyl-tRNA synthetase